MSEILSNIPLCSLGTWAIGGKGWGKVDDGQSIETIRYAVDKGINLIDTAPIYGFGHSEGIVGKALEGIRDKVKLVTKCGLIWDDSYNVTIDNSEKVLYKEIDDSLKRLNTDYVDLYLVHWPDNKTPFEETFSALAKIKEEGRAKHIGVCNFSAAQLEEAGKILEIEFLQSCYNIFEREIENEVLPFCRENDIPVMAYSPLAQGLLTGKYGKTLNLDADDVRRNKWYFQPENYPKSLEFVEKLRAISDDLGTNLLQTVISWTLRDETVVTSLCGAKTKEQIDGIITALDAGISDQTVDLIDNAYRSIFSGLPDDR